MAPRRGARTPQASSSAANVILESQGRDRRLRQFSKALLDVVSHQLSAGRALPKQIGRLDDPGRRRNELFVFIRID